MIKSGDTSLSIDHFSFNVLYGWALDETTGHFPSNMSVRNKDGMSFPVDTSVLLDRSDVRSALGRHKHASPLGFRVNLLDAFNAVPGEYSIYLGDTPVWHFADRLSELRNTPSRLSGNFVEAGHRNIVILSPKTGRLRHAVGAIRAWQSQALDKKFLSAVSVSLLDAVGFEKNQERLGRPDFQTLFVMDGTDMM